MGQKRSDRKKVITGSDLTECHSKRGPALPGEVPYEAIVQRIDNEGPREGHHGPDRKDRHEQDKIKGKISPSRSMEGLCDCRE